MKHLLLIVFGFDHLSFRSFSNAPTELGIQSENASSLFRCQNPGGIDNDLWTNNFKIIIKTENFPETILLLIFFVIRK
jgi:hypothetical protein